jgi:hypothetical protein
MKFISYIFLFVALFVVSFLKLQSQPDNTSAILENLYNRILYTNNDLERVRLNDSVKLIIDDYVVSDSIFTHRFANLRFLGQVTSSDSKIKIINWNLILRNGDNRYFCYIIRKGEKGQQNNIYPLIGAHKNEPVKTNTTYNSKNWYGALYYAIQPFKSGKKTFYLLLGLDFGNSYVSRKIIEILSFTSEDEILFGKDCIIKGKDTKFREVLEYSSEGVMTLRVHSGKSVVFDHLVSYADGQKENPEYYGSEYTFDAYIYKKGLWIFSPNVDVRNRKK